MAQTIDWKKIWDDFEYWLCKMEDTGRCESCGGSKYCFPDWDEQKDKIQELVDGQVREILEKKT